MQNGNKIEDLKKLTVICNSTIQAFCPLRFVISNWVREKFPVLVT